MNIKRAGTAWPSGWNLVRQGAGALLVAEEGLRLWRPACAGNQYCNAQIDDHSLQRRRDFAWQPPLRLCVRARFSHDAGRLAGTAGFGFWNDPLSMAAKGPPALPQAAWFFHASPDSDIRLARETPGSGWKAAVVDGGRWPWWALLPAAFPAMALMRWQRAYRWLWPVAERALGVSERLLEVTMTEWHTHTLWWLEEGVRFEVDGVRQLETPRSPRGPLGLVVWIDNQYLVATPQGRFRQGCVSCSQPQWLEISDLTVDRLEA